MPPSSPKKGKTEGWSRVHLAAKKGDVRALSEALTPAISTDDANVAPPDAVPQTPPEFDAPTPKHAMTPLMVAIRYGHDDAVAFLLERARVDSAARDAQQRTALHYAAQLTEGAAHERMITAVVDAVPDALLDATDATGMTPLHLASNCNNATAVRCLLERGASPATADASGYLPLHHAAFSNSAAALGELTGVPDVVSVDTPAANGLSALHMAAREGANDAIDVLIAAGASFAQVTLGEHALHWTPLHEAALYNRDGAAQRLMDAFHPDVNTFSHLGSSVVHLCCVANAPGVLHVLLDHGASENLVDRNRASVPRAHALIHVYGQPPSSVLDTYGMRPVHVAAHCNAVDCIRVLSQHGVALNAARAADPSADPSADSPHVPHETALHVAVHAGTTKALQALLDAGASPAVDAGAGVGTPLHMAASLDQEDALHRMAAFAGTELVNAEAEGTRLTPLHHAAHVDARAAIKVLLENGADPAGAQSITPLHAAARAGHVRSVTMLLNAGAPVDTADPTGTPLVFAAAEGHADVVSVLLQGHADPLATDTDGHSALHHAAFNDHARVVRTLLAAIPPNSVNTLCSRTGMTPLHLAASGGAVETVAALLEAGGDPYAEADDHSTPFHVALHAQGGNTRLLEVFVGHPSFDINRRDGDGSVIVHDIAAHGRLDWLHAIDRFKPELDLQDNDGHTPLHHAVFNGHTEMVQALLERGSDVNAASHRDTTILHLATHKGRIEVVRALLNAGAAVNVYDESGLLPTHIAARLGFAGVIDALVEAGADPNAADTRSDQQMTVIQHALSHGHTPIVRRLLAAGVDPAIPDAFGHSALHIAAHLGNTEAVNVILATNRVPRSSRSNTGQTPLHAAASGTAAAGETADALVRAGFRVSTADQHGFTPLHRAAHSDNVAVARALLAHKAPTDAIDARGRTPMDVATEARARRVHQLLSGDDVGVDSVRVHAATRIQAAYRGFCVRQLYTAQNRLCHDPSVSVGSLGLIDGRFIRCEVRNDPCELPHHLEMATDGAINVADAPGPYTPRRSDFTLDPATQLLAETAQARAARWKHIHATYRARAAEMPWTEAWITDAQGENARWTVFGAAAAGNAGALRQVVAASDAAHRALAAEVVAASDAAMEEARAGYQAQLAVSDGDPSTPRVASPASAPAPPAPSADATTSAGRRVFPNAELMRQTPTQRYTALHLAVLAKSKACVVVLLEALQPSSANTPDAWGRTALHMACANLETELVTTLLHGNADVNAADDLGHTPLHYVAYMPVTDDLDVPTQKRVAGLLLEEHAHVYADDTHGFSPLHFACLRGNAPIASLICSMRLNTNLVNLHGLSPAHCAAEANSVDCLRVLLEYSGHLAAKDHARRTPLHYAARAGSLEALKYLTDATDAASQTDVFAYTPLHWACLYGREACAQHLLQFPGTHGVAVNGLTPAHCAAMSGSALTLNRLLQIKNSIGVLALPSAQPYQDTTTDFQTAAAAVAAARATSSVSLAESAGSVSASVSAAPSSRVSPTPDADAPRTITSLRSTRRTSSTRSLSVGHTLTRTTSASPPPRSLSRTSNGSSRSLVSAVASNARPASPAASTGDAPPAPPTGWTALRFAVRAGHLRAINVLLHRGALDAEPTDPSARTLIHLAASVTHRMMTVSVFKLLVSYGLDPNAAAQGEGDTPLHVAVLSAPENGDGNVGSLLRVGADPSAVTRTRRATPLHLAALNNKPRAIHVLLEKGAAREVLDARQHTPLQLAIIHEHEDAVLAFAGPDGRGLGSEANDMGAIHSAAVLNVPSMIRFLAHGSRIPVDALDHRGMSPLMYASAHNCVAAVACLLELGASPVAVNARAYNALHLAAKYGRAETAGQLLRHTAGTETAPLLLAACNGAGETPLHLAVKYNHTETARVLLEAGVDAEMADGMLTATNHAGHTLLHTAAGHQTPECAHLLLSHGCPLALVDSQGMTPTHRAARAGSHKVLRLLITTAAERQEDSDVNARDAAGNTPLAYAAESGDTDTVSLLLQNDPPGDPMAVNHDGATPLHIAARYGNLECVRIFVSRLPDMATLPGPDGGCPLHVACAYGHLSVVSYLLTLPAMRDSEGWLHDANGATPLHLTGAHCDEDDAQCCAYALLTAGFDANPQDTAGETPLHAAVRRNLAGVITVLMASGARWDIANHQGDNPLDVAHALDNAELTQLLQQAVHAERRLQYLSQKQAASQVSFTGARPSPRPSPHTSPQSGAQSGAQAKPPPAHRGQTPRVPRPPANPRKGLRRPGRARRRRTRDPPPAMAVDLLLGDAPLAVPSPYMVHDSVLSFPVRRDRPPPPPPIETPTERDDEDDMDAYEYLGRTPRLRVLRSVYYDQTCPTVPVETAETPESEQQTTAPAHEGGREAKPPQYLPKRSLSLQEARADNARRRARFRRMAQIPDWAVGEMERRHRRRVRRERRYMPKRSWIEHQDKPWMSVQRDSQPLNFVVDDHDQVSDHSSSEGSADGAHVTVVSMSDLVTPNNTGGDASLPRLAPTEASTRPAVAAGSAGLAGSILERAAKQREEEEEREREREKEKQRAKQMAFLSSPLFALLSKRKKNTSP